MEIKVMEIENVKPNRPSKSSLKGNWGDPVKGSEKERNASPAQPILRKERISGFENAELKIVEKARIP